MRSTRHSPAPRLILASASPSRRQILEEAGIEFEVVVSEVDEPAVVASAVDALGELTPAEEALLLARAKAEDVASRGAARGALVLGCDSVFELDGVAYGKPYEVEVAVARWQQMRGSTGILHTGHWLVDSSTATRTTGAGWLGQRPGTDGELPAAGETVSTEITFGRPTDEQIRAYAESGEPLRCAGAFTLEGTAAEYITQVTGDRESVIGVSPAALARLRAELDRTEVTPSGSSGRE